MGYLSQTESSRQQFLKQASASKVPEIQRVATAVEDGRRKLADYSIDSIKDGSNSSYLRMFEPQDQVKIGVTSLFAGRLEKGQAFLPTGIILLAATHSAALTPDIMAELDYETIDNIKGLANGRFSFAIDGLPVVRNLTNQMFVTGQLNVVKGLYPLVNPKIIESDVELSFVIETGSKIPENTAIKLVMIGTGTIPS